MLTRREFVTSLGGLAAATAAVAALPGVLGQPGLVVGGLRRRRRRRPRHLQRAGGDALAG